MYVALGGGVGGAKLFDGLARVLAPSELLMVVNTGDDFEHLGLRISPDLDTVMYTLAGLANAQTGWGLAGETWACMEALQRLGGPTWFKLGDRDLATHLERTRRLAAGETLGSITTDLCRRHGVVHPVLPMSDQPVRTLLDTDEGELSFQDYFVRRRCEPVVRRVFWREGAGALPHPALLQALERPDLQAVILCPSNPWLSLWPLLQLAGVRERLRDLKHKVIAVSPLIAGQAVKGPAAKLMHELGVLPSALGVAELYGDFLGYLLIDEQDRHQAPAIAATGVQGVVTDILMPDATQRERLAREVCSLSRKP